MSGMVYAPARCTAQSGEIVLCSFRSRRHTERGSTSSSRAPTVPSRKQFFVYVQNRLIRRNSESSSTATVEADAPAAVQPADANQEVAPQGPYSTLPRGTTSMSMKEARLQAGRPLFFPTAASLSYLDGTLPGDYGWDPLRLADPVRNEGDEVLNLEWLSYAELLHGRWAMLGVAGMLAPEVLANIGLIPEATGLPWFQAGGINLNAGFMTGVPFFGEVPFQYWTDQYTLLYTMLIAMGFAELKRGQDYKYQGSQSKHYFLGLEKVMGGSGDPKYPGGSFFNLFNLGANPKGMARYKTAEVKHGRLAMVAALGFMVQAAATHVGPVQNLLDHVADPAHRNVFDAVGSFAADASGVERLPYILWALAGIMVYGFASSADASAAPTKTPPVQMAMQAEVPKEADSNGAQQTREVPADKQCCGRQDCPGAKNCSGRAKQ